MHSVSGLNSPGTEVPSATNTTAVTESLRPTVQPKCEARSIGLIPFLQAHHAAQIREQLVDRINTLSINPSEFFAATHP